MVAVTISLLFLYGKVIPLVVSIQLVARRWTTKFNDITHTHTIYCYVTQATFVSLYSDLQSTLCIWCLCEEQQL